MSLVKTILIIDDDGGFRRIMGEILQFHGWQVLEAADGEAGITLAKARHPDVILVDLLMPRCNGFQVCSALRADETLRGSRIIVATGRDYEADRHAAREAGADEYLTKPIRSEQLLAALRSPSHQAQSGPDPAALTDESAQLSDTTLVRFWGVRGSVPTPGPGTVVYGGNTSCVEVRAAGEILILDAGTGLRALGLTLSAEFAEKPLLATLLLSHTHWDHIQGLPFFSPVYRPQNRLRILGYEGARDGLRTVLSGQMDTPYFPIGLREVPANLEIEELKDMEFNVGSVRVRAFYANHPGICVGYRLFTAQGSVAFFPDNESRHDLYADYNDEAETPAQAYQRGEDQKLTDFLHGADILIMDSQYDANEYAQHIGWGHGCMDDVVALALRAEVKHLFLFHHDPNHDDAAIEQMVARARALVADRSASLKVDAAREGLVVELGANPALSSCPLGTSG